MPKKQSFNSDIELLNLQAEFKKPFLNYLLSNTILSIFFKLLAAYIMSIILIAFGLFENFSFFFSYFMIEVVMYNLDDSIIKP